ncbi:MAG: hypothetical protein LQ351_001506 [Letrouitia transgressa]|nr:MAG: hypothetical protein LQ351_001506 [Letrouitia transgressa]
MPISCLPDVIAILAFSVLVNAASPQKCYYSNGTAAVTEPEWPVTPCNPEQPVSMCCQNTTYEVCRPDGLCDGSDNQIWRESCTDPTWKSPRCIKLCLGENADPAVPRVITQCADGSFCCGIDEKADRCCSSGSGVWIENGTMTERPVGLSRSILSSSSTASSGASFSQTGTADDGVGFKTSSTLPASASTPASTSQSEPATKSSTGLVAGSIAGSIGAAALTFGAIQLLKHLVSRRKNAHSTTSTPQAGSLQIPSPKVEEADGFERPHETEGQQRLETDGRQRYEMRDAECELPAIELLDEYFKEPAASTGIKQET